MPVLAGISTFSSRPNAASRGAVQPCDCAEIAVDVVSREDGRQSIPFNARVRHLGGRMTFERGAVASGTWTSGRKGSGHCRLEIEPRIGTTHHDLRDSPLDETFATDVILSLNATTVVTAEIDRKTSMLHDIPYAFRVAANPEADGGRPWYESEAGAMLVTRMNGLNSAFRDAAVQFGVPVIWIMAICWMEVTHGYCDEPLGWFDANASLRPTNINVAYWSRLFSRSDMENTRNNVFAGAFLLERLRARTSPMDLPRVATLYNSLNMTRVSDYGARVSGIHRQKYRQGALIPE